VNRGTSNASTLQFAFALAKAKVHPKRNALRAESSSVVELVSTL